MLNALLWDVDGTVAETERDGHLVAFNQAFEEEGLASRWGDDRYAELLHVTGGRERLLADMPSWPDAPDTAAGREALAGRIHQRKNHWYARRIDEGRVQARPGVVALMREAAAAGLAQAIVTTTSRANLEALMPTILGPKWSAFFQAVLCGEDAVRKKPDPEAYLKALHALNLTAAQALAIEDSAPGARAAQAALVPLLLRPSAYFRSRPEGLVAPLRVCEDDDTFNLTRLRLWHSDMVDEMADTRVGVAAGARS